MSIRNFLIKRYLKKKVVPLRKKTFGKPSNVATARRYMDKMFQQFPPPEGIICTPETIKNIPVEWISVPNSRHDATLIYLHGGGYAMGSLESHRSLAGKLCLDMGLTVLNVEYRLAPENPYPAGLEDAMTIYQHLLAAGHQPEKLLIAGDSAGGGLSMATLQQIRAQNLPQPAGAILLSPWLDLTGTSGSAKEKASKDWILEPQRLPEWGSYYAQDIPLDDPRVSPLFGDMNDLCPLLVQVGTDEILLDDSLRLAEKVKQANGRIDLQVAKGQLHVWQAMWPILPEAKKAIRDIARFSDRILTQKA